MGLFSVYSGFSLDRFSVYSGFSLDRFSVYSGFGLDRFHSIFKDLVVVQVNIAFVHSTI